MNITTCPNCKMQVLPKSDGSCPSCYSPLHEISNTQDALLRTFKDYLATASGCKEAQETTKSPYLIAGILVMLLAFVIGITGTIVDISKFSFAKYFAYAGGLIGTVIIRVGELRANVVYKRNVDNIAELKPGFPEFMRLYRDGYWDKGLFTNKKLDHFNKIISLQEQYLSNSPNRKTLFFVGLVVLSILFPYYLYVYWAGNK